MTRTTNARIAGFTFLLYIAVAFPAMILFDKATGGEGARAPLSIIAGHLTEMRITAVLDLLSSFCALTLAVTLYGITREEDRELAMLGFACRVGEGILAACPFATLGLVWLAANGTADASSSTLAALLLKVGTWQSLSASILFAVGSTIFSFLLLRGRMIPVAIAWLGLAGSAFAVVILLLQLPGFVGGLITALMWIPVALFEVTLALWFLIKGVEAPMRRRTA
jgi:hypothetical protein